MKSLSLIVVLAGGALLTACETDTVVEHRHYSYSEPVRYRRVSYGEPTRRVYYYREPVRRVYYRDYRWHDDDDDLYGPDHVALRYSGAPASPEAVNRGF
jgi:hypothetical protein